jgi:hypothetical protein
MANAPNTGSTLSNNTTNKTSTALSTNILIMVGNIAVGAVQKLNITESRDVEMISEVGTDGMIDSTPKSSTKITGGCTRVRFDRLRIAEAFGRGFTHIQSQAYPFDIVIIDKQKANAGSQIVTVIKNVWITSISYSYNHDNWVITDDMNWTAETIYSHLAGGNANPVATGGERGFAPSIIQGSIGGQAVNIEQLTDTGANGRRGSLDAEGLIDIGSSGSAF